MRHPASPGRGLNNPPKMPLTPRILLLVRIEHAGGDAEEDSATERSPGSEVLPVDTHDQALLRNHRPKWVTAGIGKAANHWDS